MFDDDQVKPRHLSTGKCLCQFIEEHFKDTQKLESNIKVVEVDNLISDNCIVQTTNSDNISTTQTTDSIDDKRKSTKTLATFLRNKAMKSKKHNPILRVSKDKQNSNGIMANASLKQQQQEVTVSHIKNNFYTNTANLPTLSGLVSAKTENLSKRDNPNYCANLDSSPDTSITPSSRSKTPFSISGDLKTSQQMNSFGVNNSATSSEHDKILHCDEQVDDNGNNTKRYSMNLNNNNADVSLEMDSDLIGRSDDLVRKLRLLLELRKDDLHGLDGSTLFANALYKVPQQHLFYPTEDGSSSVENNVHTTIEIPDDNSSDTTNMKTKNLRKFFGQGEGTFNFGFKKTQKDTNMNQALEIF